MSSAPLGRYPHLFTRAHLEPIEKHRAVVLDRDEHTCLAAGVQITGRWLAGLPCASDLVVTSVADVDEPTSPIHLRTLCSNHAALAEAAGPVQLLYAANGWRAPTHVDDVLLWAALVPVRAGHAWWLLDTWGERAPLDDEWVAELRQDIHRRWPS